MVKLIITILLLGFSLPVSAQKTLIFGAIEHEPPVETTRAILQEAYKRLGITIEIKELPGRRSIRESDAGMLDGEAFRIASLEDHAPNLIRIEIPIRIDSMYLYVKKGKEFEVNGWHSIPGNYTLGYKRGLKFAEDAVAQHWIQGEDAKSAQQLFMKLDSGRNDVVVTGERVMQKMKSELNLPDIVRLEPPIHTSTLYHFLHKKHAQLAPRITAVLQEMQENGEIARIREQVESRSEPAGPLGKPHPEH